MEEFTQVPFGLQLIDGAPTGTRTPDPLIKSQPLYQLSYRRITKGVEVTRERWQCQALSAHKSISGHDLPPSSAPLAQAVLCGLTSG